MAAYRKRPVVVQAVQFDGHDLPGVFCDEDRVFYVVTIHGQRAYLTIGDWIITEPDGIHYYPCKPDIFHMTYEDAEIRDKP
jgi:hypothetical protein